MARLVAYDPGPTRERGFGKTTLAAELCRDPAIAERYGSRVAGVTWERRYHRAAARRALEELWRA